jgi:hypothetical protein
MEINYLKASDVLSASINEALMSNGCTKSKTECNVQYVGFKSVITYKDYNFIISTNTTGQKYTFCADNGNNKNYYIQSVSLQSLFKKIDGVIKDNLQDYLIKNII